MWQGDKLMSVCEIQGVGEVEKHTLEETFLTDSIARS